MKKLLYFLPLALALSCAEKRGKKSEQKITEEIARRSLMASKNRFSF